MTFLILRSYAYAVDKYINTFYISAGIVNLSMDPETSCTDSSHLNLNHTCSKAYDGKVEPEIGHEWASVTDKENGLRCGNFKDLCCCS